MNVLVVGGAGYIGSHCCKKLRQEGFVPTVMDNLVYGHREHVKWGQLIIADIGDEKQLDEMFSTTDVQAVMHFAAFAYVGESVNDPRKYYVNNLCNTVTLLNAMVRHNVRNFVFSSTCATYGNPQYIPMDEKHPQLPINPYGKSKLMVETILEDYRHAYGLNYVNLRYFNAAGADLDAEIGEKHDPETHLIPLVLDAASGRRPLIKVFGNDYLTPDGTCVRDYIHVSDLADAHILALRRLLNLGASDSFNLGTGKGHSVLEVIHAAERAVGRKIPLEMHPRREGDPPELVAANVKALKMLGWNPQITSIEDIIASAWKWHQRL